MDCRAPLVVYTFFHQPSHFLNIFISNSLVNASICLSKDESPAVSLCHFISASCIDFLRGIPVKTILLKLSPAELLRGSPQLFLTTNRSRGYYRLRMRNCAAPSVRRTPVSSCISTSRSSVMRRHRSILARGWWAGPSRRAPYETLTYRIVLPRFMID